MDGQARWLKKGGELYYGYKRHDATNEQGLVEAVYTTTANEHDSRGLKPVLDKGCRAKKKKGVFADKGYKTKSNDLLLEKQKLKNRIMHKVYSARPLNKRQKLANKGIGKTRYVVKRTFGGMKLWLGGGSCQVQRQGKMHTQHLIEAIAYNLKRSPGLVYQLAKIE